MPKVKIQMNYPIEFKQKNQTKGLTQTDKQIKLKNESKQD